MNNKPLILLVGKSGSGKTTIAEYLEKNYGMKMLESYTTRKPRYEGERGHTFITYEEYIHLPNKIGTTYFDGKYYCCTQEQCETADVYIIDPDGVKTFRRNYVGERRYYTIYLQINPIVRFWRMLKRDRSFKKAFSRVVHDHKKFGRFFPNFYISRDTIENMSRAIFERWCEY